MSIRIDLARGLRIAKLGAALAVSLHAVEMHNEENAVLEKSKGIQDVKAIDRLLTLLSGVIDKLISRAKGLDGLGMPNVALAHRLVVDMAQAYRAEWASVYDEELTGERQDRFETEFYAGKPDSRMN